MRLLALVPALALLAPALAAPAAGDFHENLGAVPDRLFVLVMKGHEFNGMKYPNTPLLEAFLGEDVEFVVHVPLVAEPHTFHLHGHPWWVPAQGRMVDTFLLRAGETHRFRVDAGSVDRHAGDWMYHCHVDSHSAGGMWGIFRVYPYATRAAPVADGVAVTLDRLGEPVDGARLTLTLDGAAVPAHVLALGGGQYVMHTPALAGATGALVVTAEHSELGTSVARVGLGGADVPTPTVQGVAPAGVVVPAGHGGH